MAMQQKQRSSQVKKYVKEELRLLQLPIAASDPKPPLMLTQRE